MLEFLRGNASDRKLRLTNTTTVRRAFGCCSRLKKWATSRT
jgi:hypothetical protein